MTDSAIWHLFDELEVVIQKEKKRHNACFERILQNGHRAAGTVSPFGFDIEQSGAEQSKSEQSRAKRSKA